MNQDNESEINSEEENQLNNEEVFEATNEEISPEFEEVEDISDIYEVDEDISDVSEVDGGIIDESEVVEDIVEDSEREESAIDENGEDEVIIEKEIGEVPKELSKEDLEKQLREYHKNLIEAALYAAGKPLNVEILSTKLEIPKKSVDELLNELAYDYLERSTALIINQIGDSYQMAIKSEYVEKISKFASGGAIAERYLRTLTIIALKQPILKSTVIKLRGSGAYEHVKYLLDNDLIEAIKKGRSQELSTTDKYAEMFGLPKNKEAMKEMMISQLGLGDQLNEPEPSNQYDQQEESSENEKLE